MKCNVSPAGITVSDETEIETVWETGEEVRDMDEVASPPKSPVSPPVPQLAISLSCAPNVTPESDWFAPT